MWNFSDAILWFQRKETIWKGNVVRSGEVCWGCKNALQLFTREVRGCCCRVWQKCHLRIELQWASVTWLASQTGYMCLVSELPVHTSSLLPASPLSPLSRVWKSAKSFKSSNSKLSSIFLIITQFQQDKWLILWLFFFKLQWVFVAIHGLFIAACRV